MFAYAQSIAFNYYSRSAHVLHVVRFCRSIIIQYIIIIILMSFSASNNFIIVVAVVVPRVFVYLAVRSFLPHVHLLPDVRVHRGIENSFI